jgi:hypothetical protein
MRFARRHVVMLLPSGCRFSATVNFEFDVEQSMFYSIMNKFLTKCTKTIYSCAYYEDLVSCLYRNLRCRSERLCIRIVIDVISWRSRQR